MSNLTVRGLLLAGVLTALLALPGEADEGPYPGLPGDKGGWLAVAVTGMTNVDRAQQAVRVPYQAVAGNLFTPSVNYPPEDPRDVREDTLTTAYFVSPAGAAHNYGNSIPVTVRTVAFGSIPVQAEIEFEQPRVDGLPTPMQARQQIDRYRVRQPPYGSWQHYHDMQGDGDLIVRVRQLSVDGVDVRLRPGCRTTRPATLTLTGRGYWDGDPAVDTKQNWVAGHYTGGNGGLITGTVAVPAFGPCATADGEDLGPLLTATVSGGGVNLRMHQSPSVCLNYLPPFYVRNGPPPPGAATPEAANCPVGTDQMPPEVPYPPRD